MTRLSHLALAASLLVAATINDSAHVHGFTAPKSFSDAVSSKRSSRKSETKTQNADVQSPLESGSTIRGSKFNQFLQSTFGPVQDKETLAKATTAGLAVSLAMVPEAVAFAFVAGVSPLVGLWTTVVLGFFAAAVGRPGTCSSASGACSVVVAALCASHGPAYLSLCALIAGFLQLAGGAMGLGKFIRLVPHPAMLGFVNGLAIIMTKAQLVHFQAGGKFLSLSDPLGSSTYGIAALTMILMKLIPKITKKLPPSLGAVIISSLVAKFGALPAKTLADVAGAETFKGGLSVLPTVGFPKVPLSVESFQVVLPYAITMAAVGLIESLLTMQLLDSMADDGKKSSSTRECVGQGVGNMLSGLTGGIGGCILVGQSVINMQSGGGVSRWSGMSMALFLAFGIVAAAPLLANVPIASLAGVMLLVCHSTFSWPSLRLARKIPKLDAFIIVLVTLVTVKKDLAFAVLSGTIVSALGFAWKQSTTISTSSSMEGASKVYSVSGPLFFGSTSKFSADLFTPKTDPESVILDFRNSRIMDHSALEAIQNLNEAYVGLGKKLELRGLSDESMQLLNRLHQGDESAPFNNIVNAEKSRVYKQAVPA